MNRLAKISLFLALGFLCACVTTPPRNMTDLCSIFEEKGGWYRSAKKAQDRWKTPIPVSMAFLHQESRFRAKAKPPRKKILWIIPGPRLSDAYGYSQAKRSTWNWYVKESGNRGADRDRFADAIDFVAWYNARSLKSNGIPLNDAYNLYLAYHEGHGGFDRRTYRNKDWLKTTASKVSALANQYTWQLQSCEEDFQGFWWWPF